jgi:hypothetical protein
MMFWRTPSRSRSSYWQKAAGRTCRRNACWIEQAIQPRLSELIEEVVGVSVVDLLSDAKLATNERDHCSAVWRTTQRDRVVSPAI